MMMGYSSRRFFRKGCLGVFSLALLAFAACGDAADEQAGGDTTPASQASDLRRAEGTAGSPGEATAGGEVPLTIEIESGSDRAALSGTGKCTHTSEGWIYGAPAALWQVEDSDVDKKVYATLTVWRPKSGGPDQFTMALTTDGRQHAINTVKGGELVGSGTVEVHPTGQGAHFVVAGTDGDGRSVRATFQCERFTEHVAEGG
ncbi:MAG TPA: hypothetical protein VFB46_05770 [Gemmatimonadaceae bacterium]|nr:hypothetical protein [Gemmatimonadaceae bacterium]